MEELRCPKCKREKMLKFFSSGVDVKNPYYKCFNCGFIAVPTEIKCRRCENKEYNLILAKDGIPYCITCWQHPLCSIEHLQEAIAKSRSVLARIK